MQHSFPPKPGRFLDPLNDYGFKYIFGNESNKEVPLHFLNQLFEGQKEIINLTYSPTEFSGDNSRLKKVFFDLLCTGPNGEQFIIEMQRAEQRYFRDRMQFYTSRLINGQLDKGAEHWNNELKEVYLIAILEFGLNDSEPGSYLQNIALTNTRTGKIFYNKLGYKFLELPNFVKTEEELATDLDRWFFLLKNMSHLDKIPDVLNKRIFQKVFKIAEISNLSKEGRKMYDSSLKAQWDYENSITFAEEKAAEKAEHNNSLNIAREMKKDGVPIAQIAKYTKLSVQEIENL